VIARALSVFPFWGWIALFHKLIMPSEQGMYNTKSLDRNIGIISMSTKNK
jgi:hypothetical protein